MSSNHSQSLGAGFWALFSTQFLGAFATYDAMSLFLLAAATWCVVAAEQRDDSTLLVIAGAALLALEQGAGAGLFLLCAAALVGLAKPSSGKSALAIQQ